MVRSYWATSLWHEVRKATHRRSYDILWVCAVPRLSKKRLMNVLQTASLNSIIRISYYTYWYLYGSLICVGVCPSYWEAPGFPVRLLGG